VVRGGGRLAGRGDVSATLDDVSGIDVVGRTATVENDEIGQ